MVRRALAAGGATRHHEGRELGGQFLLAHGGQLVGICENYHVARLSAPYAAIGAGRLVAYGAFHAMTNRHDLTLEDRAREALEAAQTYTASVRGPFFFVSTESPSPRRHEADRPFTADRAAYWPAG